MEPIIDPVGIDLIKAELTPEKKLRDTNKGGNEIYVIDWKDSPNTLREIGRLREITFRAAGGGTGKAMDIDEFDLMDNPCRQLVVWDPDAEAILGGYRFILGPDITLMENGQPRLATSHLFHFSDKFLKDYLPHIIELGRSLQGRRQSALRTGQPLGRPVYADDPSSAHDILLRQGDDVSVIRPLRTRSHTPFPCQAFP